MRIMYDSTSPAAIPTTAEIVGGYCDGIYQWSLADWQRFPNAIHVPIACFATTNAGTVLDIETGCSTPGQAPHWVIMRRAAGVDPTVYVNHSNWDLTRAAFMLQGIPEPHYWLATLDGSQPWAPGLVAIQYAGSNMSGGHYDLSAVADYWPGVDPPNPDATAGSEVIVKEVPMPALIRSADPAHADSHGTGSVYLLDGNRKRWIPSPAAPLDAYRWVDQIAGALNITTGDPANHHITLVDNQVLDLFPEDGAAVAALKVSGSFTGTAA